MEAKKYDVEVTLTEKLLGTVPKDPEIYASYIASKAPKNTDTDDEVESVEEVEQKGWTGFHTDKDGPFLFDYQVKGFFKSSGNTLKDSLKIKNFKNKIENFLFVLPRKVGLPETDGVVERPLRGMTAKGERMSLARSDSIPEGSKIVFQLTVLPQADLTEKNIRAILDYGALKGLGQFRNGGYGRFSYELRNGKEM